MSVASASVESDGKWEPVAIAVVAGRRTKPRRLRYPGLRIERRNVKADKVAEALSNGEISLTGRGEPVVVGISPPAGGLMPQWYTSERDFYHRLSDGLWPEYYALWNLGGTHYPHSAKLHDPISAPGAPAYPNLMAALAAEVFEIHQDLLSASQGPVGILRLVDKRARFGRLEFEDGRLRIGFIQGVNGGLSQFVLRATWRVHEHDVNWGSAEVPVEGRRRIDLHFDQLPAELWLYLCSGPDLPRDRVGWGPRTGGLPHLVGRLDDQARVWVSEGESETIEFKMALGKGELNKEFAESVAAFANHRGGVILLGVADDCRIVGFDGTGVVDRVTNIVRELVEEPLAVDIRRVLVGRRPVWIINIPAGNVEDLPYRAAGHVYVRANGSDRHATTREIQALARRAVLKNERASFLSGAWANG